MSYSVEIRVDTFSGHGDLSSYLIPHTFLVVTDGNGVEYSWGYAPQETGLSGQGNASDNAGHPYDSTSGKIPITEEQYNDLINYINQTDANPYEYNLPLGAQCAVWAMNGLQEAGIIDQLMLPDYGAAMKDPLLGILQTLFYNPYTQKIGFEVNDLWNAFKNWTPPRRDPLVLDLDGDGIETLGVNATTHVVFDYDGDGVKTGTGWIKGDKKVNCEARETTLGCGFVVLDRNGNGTIDNGGELFGDQTLVNGVKASDGFSALSGEDSNHDGKFDEGDTNFTNVRIWQDGNSDGISQASELHTLNELGITSINLTSTASGSNLNGNIQTAIGAYTKTDGIIGTSGTLELDDGSAGNLNFSQNQFYSEFTDHLTLTDTTKALPDMQGSGMEVVNNLEFKNERRVA